MDDLFDIEDASDELTCALGNVGAVEIRACEQLRVNADGSHVAVNVWTGEERVVRKAVRHG